jgi:hypothetical protein
MRKRLQSLLLGTLTGLLPAAEPAYTVLDLPGPEGAVIEAGGLDHWPDGTLLVATRRGDV